jgi:exodeoxyribonuclease VII small subunit
MPKKKSPSPEAEEIPFEEAMERVEAIVEAMESDSLALEDMLAQYEEGARLLTQCQDRIEAALKRVEIIASERKSGAVTLKAFDGADDTALDSPVIPAQIDPPDSVTHQDSEEGTDDIRLF